MATGSIPFMPRPPRKEWWQKNAISTDTKDVTDICFHCGHCRDFHTKVECHAMATWNVPDSRECPCQNPSDYWVRAQIIGIDISKA
jgi:hypothetical protein